MTSSLAASNMPAIPLCLPTLPGVVDPVRLDLAVLLVQAHAELSKNMSPWQIERVRRFCAGELDWLSLVAMGAMLNVQEGSILVQKCVVVSANWQDAIDVPGAWYRSEVFWQWDGRLFGAHGETTREQAEEMIVEECLKSHGEWGRRPSWDGFDALNPISVKPQPEAIAVIEACIGRAYANACANELATVAAPGARVWGRL